MPKVSVVIPCYNHGPFLEESVGSILAQTCQDFEILIVNDGSTDPRTLRILAECQWPKTRTLHKENGHLSSARNHGIRHAQGEYILTLDADDGFAPTFLEKAVAALDRCPEVGVVTCGRQNFGWDQRRLVPQGGQLKDFLAFNSCWASALFRRVCWEEAGGYDENMKAGYEDWEFWLRVCRSGWRVEVLPEILFFYRKAPVSMITAADRLRPALVDYMVRKHRDVFAEHVVDAVHGKEIRIQALEEELERLRTSFPYRVGRLLVQPHRVAWGITRRLLRNWQPWFQQSPLRRFLQEPEDSLDLEEQDVLSGCRVYESGDAPSFHERVPSVLVIFSRPTWQPDGDCLRMENIFKRLRETHRLIGFALTKDPAKTVPAEVVELFHRVYVSHFIPIEGFLGRVERFLAGKCYLEIRHTDPELYDRTCARVRAVANRESIDVIHVWHSNHAQFVPAQYRSRALIDICDSLAHTFAFENGGLSKMGLRDRSAFHRLARYERQLIRKFHTCFVSERDPDLLGVTDDKLHIIPNGVDTDYFTPRERPPGPPAIGFTGNMSFRPNVDAVLFFYREIWPELKRRIPDLIWYIAGAKPSQQVTALGEAEGIIVTGFVDDIRDVLAKIDVFVCPMISGLGIKNKLLEAMAMGKACVTTSFGAAGVAGITGTHFVVADTPGQIVDSIVELMQNQGRCNEIGNRARQLVESCYSWQTTVADYLTVYSFNSK